ncbi:MAG: hypothetical protein D6698_15245 [Gammaproteobacteria bacterium]|nr:MAG: hypothetical protein D6698_15245 [Gammaproteobacteria bacterium]
MTTMLLASGCSSEAKKATTLPEIQTTPPLEVPPDLVLPKTLHSMDIPPEKAAEDAMKTDHSRQFGE